MARLEFLSNSSGQTKKFAGDLAKELKKSISQKQNKATVVGVYGDLGAGKTTFVQGFSAALGVRERITSPTFVIMKKFGLHSHKMKRSFFSDFCHFDFYRLRSKKDLAALGMKEMLSDPKNLMVIEWPDTIKGFGKNIQIKVKMDHIGKNSRKIRIESK